MPFIKIGIVLIIALFLAFRFISRSNPALPTIKLHIASLPFTLEIATSTLQHARGLSNRPTLCAECGMIFVFKNEAIRTFWMKDTLIPLDIIFLDGKGVVNTIHTAAPQPGVNDLNLKLYSSEASSRYVIELPAGTAAKLGLTPGNSIDLSPLNL